MEAHCELSWRSSQPAYPGKVDRRESGYRPSPADVDAMGVFGSCDPQAQRLNQSGKPTKAAGLKPSGFNRAQVGQRGFGANSIRIEQVGMLPVSVVPSGVNMRMGIGRLSQKLHDTSASTAGQGPAGGIAAPEATQASIASAIGHELIRAYLETHYQVSAVMADGAQRFEQPEPAENFVLRIGQASEELLDLYRAMRVDCSAYITACNPLSQALSPERNRARMEELKAELISRSLKFRSGQGVHPSNGWEPEPSVLVLGLSREAARRLGERWEQNAIVWAGADAIPELMLLR